MQQYLIIYFFANAVEHEIKHSFTTCIFILVFPNNSIFFYVVLPEQVIIHTVTTPKIDRRLGNKWGLKARNFSHAKKERKMHSVQLE